MAWMETYFGVFTAQLTIWLAQWIIKTYIEPKWTKLHKHATKKTVKITKRIARALQ